MSAPDLPFVDDHLRHWSARRPHEPAAIFGETSRTWRELQDGVEEFARALSADGVGPGDRVAMLAGPRPEFLEVFLATASLGAIWLGLNPRYRVAELRRVLADAEPSVLVVVPAAEPRGDDLREADLRELIAGQPSIRTLVTPDPVGVGLPRRVSRSEYTARGAGRDLAPIRAARDPLAPTLLVYTSGSTGRPKGALLTHRGLTRCAGVQAGHWDVAAGERVLCNLPINHVGCVGDLCVSTLVQGGTLCFAEHFDPEQTLALIARERVAMWGQIPVMFQLAVATPGFATHDLSSLRRVVWSGAACPPATAEALARIGAAVSTGYGLTETTGSVTYSDPDAPLADLVETVGRPEPGYEVRVARPDGAACAVGEAGEVQVRGDFVMAGYWRLPAESAAAFTPDGWLHTGDGGTLRADGNLILHGRMSDVYRSGGYHVAPREVESALDEHPGVAAASVVAVPDPLWGRIGHAFVVPRDPGLDPAALREHVRARLANYKVPKVFELCAALPLLPNGKVDKGALRARAETAGDRAEDTGVRGAAPVDAS